MASTVVVSVGISLAFVSTLVGLISFVRGVSSLARTMGSGADDHTRTDHIGTRLWQTVLTAVSHRSFKGRPVVKVAHWLVMFSFIALVLTLANSYVQVRSPLGGIPIIGDWPPFIWLFEVFAWLGLFGIVALMAVRFWANHGGSDDPRFSRFYGSTRWQAHFVEWVILLVCLCVIVLHGLDFAAAAALGEPVSWLHYPLTSWLGSLFAGLSIEMIANLIVLFSALKIVVSMGWMTIVGVQTTMGVSWHRFLAPINIFAARSGNVAGTKPDSPRPSETKSLGGLAPMLLDGNPVTTIEDLPDEATLGLGSTPDLTWKDRLDLYSCTECGRCQSVCPAWNTNKPLSPKLMTLALRDNVASASQVQVTVEDLAEDASAEPTGEGETAGISVDTSINLSPDTVDVLGALIACGTTGPEGVPFGNAPLVDHGPGVPGMGGVLNPDVLWDCTMCGACVEQCPVDIEHVDRIANLRRFQVLMESAFPRDLARPFKGMETKGNPYGQAARKRLDWAKKLDFEVPVIGEDIEDATAVDYLFWVGCAGAYDDRQKKTTAAVAQLLHTAGVSFAVLGSGESCTGDPARRAGNEVLFQMLAEAAIETLNEAKAQRIVVTCAHCFNTIANEFPELGGHFEVIHHTQLLNRLVREDLLHPVAPPADEAKKITYHDPCFLGRHNRVFEAPRELLAGMPGVELAEMQRNREDAMCCGAGGARAWMEETRGTRIATNRMEEAVATGANTIATACPFCTQMLDSATSSITASGEDSNKEAPVVKDVAVLLLESVQRGQE